MLPLLVTCYVGCGYGLGAIALGRAEKGEPTGGEVPVVVFSNGYHASLILPVAAAGIDWSAQFQQADFAAPALGATHVMLGWGEREFYMNTRTLADFDLILGARAVVGLGGAVMHVTWTGQPDLGANARLITLTPERYRALARFIDLSVARDGAGDLTLYPGRGYGKYDAFYQATGRYSLFMTCNEWVGRALRAAGAPTGLWTPFASSLLREPVPIGL